MDGVTLYCIRKELAGYLPMKVQKIGQPESSVLVFSLWNRSDRKRLVLSLLGKDPFFGFSEERHRNPANPPGFCLGLRKRLEGGLLTGVRQQGMDRVLYLDFSGHDDFGDVVPFTVVFDMAGRGANIGLYRGEGPDAGFISAALPVDGIRFGTERPYLPPEQKFIVTTEEGRSGLGGALKDSTGPALGSLLGNAEGFGRDLALSVLHEAGCDPDVAIPGIAVPEVIEVLKTVAEDLEEMRFAPAIYETAGGTRFCHALRLRHLGPLRTYPTVMEAVADLRVRALEERELLNARRAASSLYTKVLKKLESRYVAQLGDLKETEHAQRYRLWGELLNTSGAASGPGKKEVQVQNYYDDPPSTLAVPLDPRYSIRDNARLYFAKYGKLTRASKMLSASTDKLRTQIERLRTLEPSLSPEAKYGPSDLYDALYAIDQVARDSGVRTRGSSRRKDVPEARTEQGLPRSVVVVPGPEGATAFVGGNAKANDYLATRHKRPGDVWLHAKATRGAHVILRPPHGAEISDSMLLFAARLAAERSKSSGATNVEVDLVDAMRVKKPKGTSLGFVTYTGQKTVVVSMTTPATPPPRDPGGS